MATTQRVQAKISVKSANFNETLEEPIDNSPTTDQLSSYQGLIAANERLKANISKIFTEFVNKARLEQQASGDTKKRKIKDDDENENEEDEEDGNDDDEDDAESSDNNEEQK